MMYSTLIPVIFLVPSAIPNFSNIGILGGKYCSEIFIVVASYLLNIGTKIAIKIIIIKRINATKLLLFLQNRRRASPK